MPVPRWRGLGAALVDSTPRFGLLGLPPGSLVSIRAQARDASQVRWMAWAEFRADADGAVSPARQAPLQGSYQGVDPGGLIWSMVREGDPAPFVVGGTSVQIELFAEYDHAPPLTARMNRWLAAPGVRLLPVRTPQVVGTLALPMGPPLGAVVLVAGSGGGTADDAAALLASHGMLVLALALFGVEGTPAELVEVPLERIAAGIAWLRAHPTGRGLPLTLMGRSRGGEAVLATATWLGGADCVVAFVPSGLTWGGLGARGPVGRSAWTLGGEGLPWPGQGQPLPVLPPEPDGLLRSTPLFETLMDADPDGVERATIPVERITAPVLLISGGADAVWPSRRLSTIAEERLRGHGRICTHRSYDGVGHQVWFPHLPTTADRVTHRLMGRTMAFGGRAREQAAASVHAWGELLRWMPVIDDGRET